MKRSSVPEYSAIDEGVQSVRQIGVFEDLADAWLACLRAVLAEGAEVRDLGRSLRELLNVTLSARGCDERSLIQVGADARRIALMREKYESLVTLPEYNMSYGRLFRDHRGVDQIEWLVQRLRRNPESKSATIGFHVPGSADLSCISLLDCKLRNGLLHVNSVFRSQNVYGSQPGNGMAISRLQREIAQAIDAEPGYLTLHILSAHIYEEDVREVLNLLEPPSEVVP
jgi:hypothetical protein